MKKQNTFIVGLAVFVAVCVATWLALVAPMYTGNEINMTRGVSSLANTHYDLHMIILIICAIIGILVFTAMFTSIVLHRKSKGHEPAQFSHSTKAEIAWTVIPVLILIGMAIPATSALIEAGVRIFLYERGFIHAKTMVVDDWVTTIGSANLDMRSFYLNFELNAFIFGHAMAGRMTAQFEEDLRHAVEVDLEEERKAGVARRLMWAGARLLSPLL